MNRKSSKSTSLSQSNENTVVQDFFSDEHSICYGCGRNNSLGLHIRTHWDGEIGTFRFTPEDYHTAFPGIVYGGLIASLFDCHCIGTAIAAAYDAEGREPGSQPAIMFVTANLNVNYVRPTPMDRELTLNAHIVETKGRKSIVACTLIADDVECANATVVAIRSSRKKAASGSATKTRSRQHLENGETRRPRRYC